VAGSWIEVDRERLVANVGVFRQRLGATCALMAVVKANAYGHGAAWVLKALAPHVDWFGVDSLSEALYATRPTLILGHTEPKLLDVVVARGLRQVVFRRDTAAALSRAATRLQKPAYVHLKIETGLHRLGVTLVELPDFARELAGLDGIVVEGVYTHFAEVENPQSMFYREQLDALNDALEVLQTHGIEPSLVHAFPTAGVMLHHPVKTNLARVGIGLFGIWPSRETRDAAAGLEIQPVLSWRCRIAQIKSVPAGASVGYDRRYRASGDRRIAVIPVGYADGFDRSLSGRGMVIVRGRRAPVVGRVAMNMTMIDVTETEAQEDDEVVLIGEQGGASITAEDVAAWSDTIAYEVVARLSRELPGPIG
jgi:alanine racemase